MKGGERTMTNERTFSKDKKQRGGISLRNLLNKKLKNEKGLTLIELLAVIVILAIIALIAIPAIGSIVSNSKSKAILSDATSIIAGAKTAIIDGACSQTAGSDTVTCKPDDLKGYLEDDKGTFKSGDQVEKKADGTYEITYADFKNLNEKYTKALGGTKPGDVKKADSVKIAKAMGNKPEETEKTANP